MWAKTLIGLFLGLLLAMSIFLNIGYLIPMPRDILLFSGYVGIFLAWAGFMTWFYSAESLKKPMKIALPLFFGSVGINSLFYLGVIG